MRASPPEYIASVVRYNTGKCQPTHIERFRLKLISVAHGDLTSEGFDEALEVALDEGLLSESSEGFATTD